MAVIYLYGFAPRDAPAPDALVGVGDARVELLPVEGANAVIGRLDEDEYGPAAVEEKGGDVEWMAEKGLRHEEVVAWFVDHASILPSRLLTLFRSESSLREAVGADAGGIERQLARFADLREWDLKVTYDPAALEEHLGELSDDVAALDAEIDAAGPGRKYLLERKRADLVQSQARVTARSLAGELLDAVRDATREVNKISPPSDEVPVVLNAALLVPTAREQELRDTVRREADRLGGVGLTVEFSGPWAPYRFMDESA